MLDNSISDSAPEDSSTEDSGVKVYAPLSTLEVDGQAPEVGDSVELTVKGTVESLDGDVACVTPVEVNGEPAPAAPADDSSPSDDMSSERDRLSAKASAADGSY